MEIRNWETRADWELISSFQFLVSKKGGSNSVVESQPSKLLVAGSIPVSRSSSKFETGNSKFGREKAAEFRFSKARPM